MNICCLLFLLIVDNNVGRVLYANNVGQLLYVVFAPPAICYFWRFICFVAVFCSLVDTLTT